jgi:hypothetical protein
MVIRAFHSNNRRNSDAITIMKRHTPYGEAKDDTLPAEYLARLYQCTPKGQSWVKDLIDSAAAIVANEMRLEPEAFWLQNGKAICQAIITHLPRPFLLEIVNGLFNKDIPRFMQTSRITPGKLSKTLIALLAAKVSLSFLINTAQQLSIQDILPHTPVGSFFDCAARGGSALLLKIALQSVPRQYIFYGHAYYGLMPAGIRNGSPQIMQEIEAATFTSKTFSDFDFLVLAARTNSLAWLQKMIFSTYMDSRIDNRRQKNKLLHEAARFGNTDVLKLFRLTAYDLNQPRYLELTLLASAASRGQLGTMEWLLQQGVTDLECAMLTASAHGYIRAVKLLLESGYNLNTTRTIRKVMGVTAVMRKGGIHPIILAAEFGHVEIVQLFWMCNFTRTPQLTVALSAARKKYRRAMNSLE